MRASSNQGPDVTSEMCRHERKLELADFRNKIGGKQKLRLAVYMCRVLAMSENAVNTAT
jgi:hypothetical protein